MKNIMIWLMSRYLWENGPFNPEIFVIVINYHDHTF